MSNMTEDIQIDLVLPQLGATSRKNAFQYIAREVAPYLGCAPIMLLDCMMDKEKDATSGVGHGVAIPHLKLSGIDKPFTALVSLNNALDFEAPDNKPVDLVCLVISPESDGPLHLRRLSRISRMLHNESLHEKICETDDADAIHALFMAPEEWMMAA